jgi:hypothetical protein
MANRSKRVDVHGYPSNERDLTGAVDGEWLAAMFGAAAAKFETIFAGTREVDGAVVGRMVGETFRQMAEELRRFG